MKPARATTQLGRLLRDQGGQAMVEYASISSILLLMLLAVTVNASSPAGPITTQFIQALQGYVDLMFYALNTTLG